MKEDLGAKVAFDTLPEHLRPSKAGGDNLQSNPASSTFVDLRSNIVKTKPVGAPGHGRGLGMRASPVRPSPRFMAPGGPHGPPRMPFSLRGAPRHPPPFHHPGGFRPPPPGPRGQWRGPPPRDMWRPPYSGIECMVLCNILIFDVSFHWR